MLGDVDHPGHFSQLLEIAYCEAATELNDICHKFAQLYHEERYGMIEPGEVIEQCDALNQLQFVMIKTVQQTIERRRRLANVPAGFADVVLNEEGSKE